MAWCLATLPARFAPLLLIRWTVPSFLERKTITGIMRSVLAVLHAEIRLVYLATLVGTMQRLYSLAINDS
jgi:hypothetical protein